MKDGALRPAQDLNLVAVNVAQLKVTGLIALRGDPTRAIYHSKHSEDRLSCLEFKDSPDHRAITFTTLLVPFAQRDQLPGWFSSGRRPYNRNRV